MSVGQSRTRRLPDYADQATLFPQDGVPIVATTTGVPINMQRLSGETPGIDAVIPGGVVSVAVYVKTLNLSTNSYEFQLLTAAAESMADPAVLLSLPLVAVGSFETALDSSQAPASHKWLAARIVVGGTPASPSITIAACLAQSRAR